jgi:hypothetical protein
MKGLTGLLGTAISKNNVSIRLTKERWLHIQTAHPEIEVIEQVFALDTVENPDIVLKGDKDELLAVKKKSGKKMWFVVVYKEIEHKDGFILTAYITTDEGWLFKRKVVWNKAS